MDTDVICLHLDTNIPNYPPRLLFDKAKNLHYVSHNGKPLYFPRTIPTEKIPRLYLELVMEQDARSPHCYFSDIERQLAGRTLLDVGAAEGIVTLTAIDIIGKAYLFECDPAWTEALEATFEPYKDKVIIVNRLVGEKDDDRTVTLTTFLSDKADTSLFIKMDIEGMEATALRGADGLMRSDRDVAFAVCTYHENDDGAEICRILSEAGCTLTHRRGFFRNRLRSVTLHGHNHREPI